MRLHKVVIAVALTALVTAPAMGGIYYYPSDTTTGVGEVYLWDIYNQLYGTSLSTNVELVDTYGMTTQLWDIAPGGSVMFEIEVAWMNAYFTQDIGIYTVDGGGNPVIDFSVLAPVTNAYAGLGDVRGLGLTGSFTATEDWGVADNVLDIGGSPLLFTWYSEDARNEPDSYTIPDQYADGDPHIMFLSTDDPNTYVIAIEDLPFEHPESHEDFNDIVLELRVVPEPSSMLLLGLGIAGIAISRFRKVS